LLTTLRTVEEQLCEQAVARYCMKHGDTKNGSRNVNEAALTEMFPASSPA
jgi:hypothetical protein